jgi:PAS domain-containing protein
VSDDVLESVSRALQLDEAEHAHLVDLVRTANKERPPRKAVAPVTVRPSIRRIVDALREIPAFVSNGRLDILYANPLAEALYSEHFRDPVRPVNSARFTFLDPLARTFYPDWETLMRDAVAALHGEVGRNPYDRALSDLIGLLSTLSEESRVEWARHDVRFHRSGTKRMHHPLVGDLTLAYERLEPEKATGAPDRPGNPIGIGVVAGLGQHDRTLLDEPHREGRLAGFEQGGARLPLAIHHGAAVAVGHVGGVSHGAADATCDGRHVLFLNQTCLTRLDRGQPVRDSTPL